MDLLLLKKYMIFAYQIQLNLKSKVKVVHLESLLLIKDEIHLVGTKLFNANNSMEGVVLRHHFDPFHSDKISTSCKHCENMTIDYSSSSQI